MALLDVRMSLNCVLAALLAVAYSFQHCRSLRIRRSELFRYLAKSVNLSLCYAGLGVNGTFREAAGAGKAAFLCCAYDVVTDWRGFDTAAQATFEDILRRRLACLDLETMARELYEKEKSKQLRHDGLERGPVALRFVLGVMGCEHARIAMWGGLDDIGRLLQIVDDVLDYEEDMIRGEVNCLGSISRDIYLRELLDKFNAVEIRTLFGPNGSILIRVIQHARSKAERLLKAQLAVQDNTVAALALHDRNTRLTTPGISTKAS